MILLVLAILASAVSVLLSTLIVSANMMSDAVSESFQGGSLMLFSWLIAFGLWTAWVVT